MSQENLEVALKQFEGTNARDFAGVMDTWAEDVTLIVHWQAGQLSDRETGKAAVGEWFGDWFRRPLIVNSQSFSVSRRAKRPSRLIHASPVPRR